MPSPPDLDSLYETLGEKTIAALTAAFYRRVRADDLLGPMYPADDFDAAEHRLREFLVQRLGGPPRYSAERGHPRLRMRHAPFPIDRAARDRWMQLMTEALAEVDMPADAAAVLHGFFEQVATFMINREG